MKLHKRAIVNADYQCSKKGIKFNLGTDKVKLCLSLKDRIVSNNFVVVICDGVFCHVDLKKLMNTHPDTLTIATLEEVKTFFLYNFGSFGFFKDVALACSSTSRIYYLKPKRWIISDNVALDTKTNLEWLIDFPQKETPMTFRMAKAIIQEKYPDWRLPTKEELKTLITKKPKKGLFINKIFNPNKKTEQNYSVWSSSFLAYNSNYMWTANFNYKHGSNRYKNNSFYMLLVRSSQQSTNN